MAVVTEFESEADMKYYDNDCEAHAKLKAVAKGMLQGPPMMVYFEPAVMS